MDLRTPVKHVLRMCGHAIVSTVHERLNVVDRVLQDILDQNAHIAGTQTALLQSGIHLVENIARVHVEIQEVEERLEAQVRALASQADVQSLLRALAELRAFSAGKDDLQARVQAEIQQVEERLGALQDVLEQTTHIASTQTALLQSSIQLIDNMAQLQAGIQQLDAGIQSHEIRMVGAGRAELQLLQEQVRHLDQRLRDSLSANLEALHSMSGQIESVNGRLAPLEPIAYETKSFLANESVRQVCVETSDYLSTNPEVGLFSFLYSFLPSRTVLDIGAHVGDVSAHLLQVGYEVYAFEPYPKSYHRLQKRLGAHPGFHALNCALGSTTGEAPLYVVKDNSPDKRYEDPTVFFSLAQHGMPADLPFTGSVPVTIRRLSQVHKDGLVPADAGLVKIDTEGYDLEVIRGMDDYRYPVVTVEFWDTEIPFGTQGLLYTIDSMVCEMRQRGYLWYIVIYRIWGQNQTAFYCNHDRSVPGSWGNIVFFQDREMFVHAQQWCSAALPRTYFKHVQAAPEGRTKIAANATET